MEKTRVIDPFFYEAINQIFKMPEKQAFVMDGPLGIGKSSNFVMLGAYTVAQSVKPIRKGNKWVRESKWAAIRESEQSAITTVNLLISEAIFSPEIMSMQNSPVKQMGSHPTKIIIEHAMSDGTHLKMLIECHGFNNKDAHNRLRSHEFLGAMMFEMQGIPFDIFEVAMQRCGRYRTQELVIEKEIDGKVYRLTGARQTAIVLADINIPERPDALYERWYDVNDQTKLPYTFITPPPPLLHRPADSVPKAVRDKYPVTVFEGERTVWLPNPEVYFMTRHFEERDDEDNNIPYTGYDYWFDKLHLVDSHIRRYILGLPDTIGGEAAVYKGFAKSDKTVVVKDFEPVFPINIGFDPGGYAAFEIMQLTAKEHLHMHKEFFFEPSDGVGTRQQIEDFVLPWCEETVTGYDIVFTPDPASSWLGKSVMMSSSETPLTILQDAIAELNKKGAKNNYSIEPCVVQNQDVAGRVNALGYFIEKGKLTVDPSCEMFITGLVGGYAKLKTKSGIISETIDKLSRYSHPVEAAQYSCANLLRNIKRRLRKNGKSKRQVSRIKTRR